MSPVGNLSNKQLLMETCIQNISDYIQQEVEGYSRLRQKLEKMSKKLLPLAAEGYFRGEVFGLPFRETNIPDHDISPFKKPDNIQSSHIKFKHFSGIPFIDNYSESKIPKELLKELPKYLQDIKHISDILSWMKAEELVYKFLAIKELHQIKDKDDLLNDAYLYLKAGHTLEDYCREAYVAYSEGRPWPPEREKKRKKKPTDQPWKRRNKWSKPWS